MSFQVTQVGSHMERAATAYSTPHFSHLGSIRNVTSASQPGGVKGDNTAENAPGVGTIRKP